MKAITNHNGNRGLRQTVKWLCAAVLFTLHVSLFTSCVDNDDDIPENMYTAQKMTAGAFLEADQERFSSFTTLLKRTPYFSLLTTYGTYTLFAPTNNAMSQYLADYGYSSVEDVPQEVCDTIARTHIIRKGAFFTTDVVEGDLDECNMLDRRISWVGKTDSLNDNRLVYYVNGNARMTEFNDSVTNGVVHVIESLVTASSNFLPDKMEEDSTITLFCAALRLTGMADSLQLYIDESYSCGDDSVYNGTRERCTNGSDLYMDCKWVGTRYFKYTAFVEPDSVFHRYDIYTVDQLAAYAKEVYDQVYPEDAGKYDNDPKNRRNPLNRFVSYHLLDRIANYNQLVCSGEIRSLCWKSNLADVEEYYETMCPGTLMRFASPAGSAAGIYINRRGLQDKLYDAQSRGVKVFSPTESVNNDREALNGIYHYIDDILTFNLHTRDVIFNCRMRFDPATLSPDFMNCDGRGHYMQGYITGFKRGFTKNWEMSEESFVGVTSDNNWWRSFLGHVVVITKRFDVTLKLPPVPKRGTYEIRMGYTPSEERGVIQCYLNGQPCGIPVDMRIGAWDPEIGYIADGSNAEENKLNDKALHNRGYMKPMDCWHPGGGDTSMRELFQPLRRILATENMDPEKTYYLRMRQVLDDPEKYCNFNYLEICPKSVYASPDGEDTH